MPLRSERSEDHEDFVTAVVGREPEGSRPATDLTPSEPSVEVLQSLASPGREVQLLKPQLVAGDPLQSTDEGGSDSASAEGGMGLEVVDRAPVPDEPVGIAIEDDPSGENVVGLGGDQTAVLWIETAKELVHDGRHVVVPDGREREPSSAAPVGDRDPAVDQLSSEFGCDAVRVSYLDEVEGAFVRHEKEHVRGHIVAEVKIVWFGG
jgi:hypothetical protein